MNTNFTKPDGSMALTAPAEADGTPHVFVANAASDGSATAAKQDTGNTSLAAIAASAALGSTAAKQPALGTAAMAASRPVTIATDDTVMTGLSAKLPAASATADAEASATAMSRIATRLMGFNGATWDRIAAGLVAVSSTFTGMLTVLPWGIFHTAPTVRTNGQGGPLETAASGSLLVQEGLAPAYENGTDSVANVSPGAVASSTLAWSTFSSASGGQVAVGKIVKATPGRIRRIHVRNSNATTGLWFQLFDSATLPTTASTVSKGSWFIGSQTIAGQGSAADRIIDFGAEGLYCATGITLAASSTIDIFTVLVATDSHFLVEYF